ncbi:MAG TPA: FimV/HubP family polar landmark protein, partial [Ottowia sp.]|nr:FimV/HubP family polar landmark protein [Ottowia sp.]
YVGVVIEASWANGRVVRDYTLLLDPPGREALPAVVATQPQAPAPARPAVAEQTTPRPSATPAPRAAPRPERTASAAGGEQITVQRGDTLSRIAGAHAIDGVSLDQMMVALLQANPDAFIRGNVNLIKAGAVLQMPSAEQARATPRQAARRAVVAQSKDFQAYRHAVAKAAPAQAQDAGGGQTASGSVQAQVSDRKAPAPTPDQLKISKGGAPGGAETTAALSRQAQEQADREAELKRNISALKDLTSTASAPATSAPAPTPAAAAASSEAPGVNVPLAAGATAAATAASAATAAAASTTETSAAAPAPDASAAATAEAPAAAASAPADAASATLAASTTAAPAPAPAVAAPAPAPAAEPSFLDGLTDNPLLPVAGAGLIALLAGLGIYRARQRKQKDAARDSEFIESRLQPDSFFGGSGGQQVDTKERASGGSSSMAYSPSQLDAAGDVDPVAEADGYLAYGRDMQAEEILKEALLTHPGRISVHRKLAEIYAKRRDARALEALASEAHTLTQGDGPDWQAIASLGAELDPN